MKIRSTEFKDGAALPDRFAADHANISPPFQWEAAPAETRSFALLCEDPDAPRGTFMHWAIYNIGPEVDYLPENGSLTLANSEDIFQAVNDAGTVGYFGPKPPRNSTHHYSFRLLALDEKTHVPAGITIRDLLQELDPHIIDQASTTATYSGH
jgi:Raf kinase inhibitor-like YbhB/YbcL family protein